MRVLSYADPVYPESALNSNQGGEVEVRVLISPEGTIANVVDVKGPDIFRAAALEAVNGAELTPPTSIYGQSVVVCGTLVVSFQPAHGGLSWLNLRTGP
jgi:TonB family protein